MAGLTGLRKAPAVRVLVAVFAGAKGQARQSRLSSRAGGMTFLAGHLCMQPGQGVARFRVVKTRCRFPVREIVALRTVRPQPAGVRIFMAGDTILRSAQVSAGQVLDLDQWPIRGADVRWGVALLAGHSGVLALEGVAGLAVVKRGSRRVPANQVEIHTIVVRMAARTLLAIGRILDQGRMQSTFLPKSLRDFVVAIQALQVRGHDAQGVAARTLGDAIQRLMGSR